MIKAIKLNEVKLYLGLWLQRDQTPSLCRSLAAKGRHGGWSRKLNALTVYHKPETESELGEAFNLKASETLSVTKPHLLNYPNPQTKLSTVTKCSNAKSIRDISHSSHLRCWKPGWFPHEGEGTWVVLHPRVRWHSTNIHTEPPFRWVGLSLNLSYLQNEVGDLSVLTGGVLHKVLVTNVG